MTGMGAALMGVLGACGSLREQGLLGRVDAGCDGAGGPVVGATVRVVCPGEMAPRMVATSDAAGRFAATMPSAPIPMSCGVVIERPGFVPRSLRLEDVCLDSFGSRAPDGCERAAFTVRLVPAGGAL